MTAPVDELRDRTRRLEAERLRPERQMPPRQLADMREVLAVLERLLRRPGPVDALSVLRFDPSDPSHLVVAVVAGAPAGTLCGIALCAEDTPTWTLGGRHVGADWNLTPCPACVTAARRDHAGVPITGAAAFVEPIDAALAARPALRVNADSRTRPGPADPKESA
ncbi:hypothetical protein [Streptosporangium sandarakinum]